MLVESSVLGVAEVEAVVVPSDDEEESRARVIKKKARVDVFGQQGKGKKGRKDGNVASSSSHEQGSALTEKSVETSKAAGEGIPDQEKQEKHDSPKSKKNKKRHPLEQPIVDLTDSLPPSPTKDRSVSGTVQDGDQKTVSGRPPSVKDMDKTIPNINHSPQSYSSNLPKSSSKTVSNTAASLLNLSGPLEEVETPSLASPKKKRRRKKKKKKSIAEVAAEEDASASDD